MDINYTKQDYIATTAPYEEVESCSNPFEQEQKIAQLADHARSVGVRNFITLYKKYVKTMRMVGQQDYVENASNFSGQEMELNTGNWTADDFGISRIGYGGQEEIACPHPVMPVMRLSNVDTAMEKVKLAYKKGVTWRSIIVDRKQIASNNLIIGLADYGIAVTSENSKHLVKYLHDAENLNYDRIPEKKSVSRLGWVGGEGFSPYVDDLVFDGEDAFRTFFESVQCAGSYDKWVKAVKEIRACQNPVPKLILAASFASVLVGPCACLPFFVHTWGGTETGKTVGLMLAASVWANPEMGKYVHTFNSTAVAQELSAGFVNSLPLILDELQIVKEKKDFDQMIYQLSEGVGKARGQKTGGLQRTGTWANCIITSGEQPITSSASGGGAVNRIIEINCEETKLFDDPGGVVRVMKQNYGHAGKAFIDLLGDEKIMEEAIYLQQTYYKEINKKSTEKQALAASLILTADLLINNYIFRDDQYLSYQDIEQFLSSKDEVSQGKRAYEWLQEWIVQNRSKFLTESSGVVVECYGRLDRDSVSIIRNVFNHACADNGFNAASFAAWLKRNDLTETDADSKRLDKKRRINGSPCRCIVLKLEEDTPEGFVEVGNAEQIEL